MKYALVSDVHSNLEALERTFEAIKKKDVRHVVCLGDIVGYGANPSECLRLVKKEAQEIVMGNHDRAVEDIELRDYFNPDAREAIEWTAGKLNSEEKKLIRGFCDIIIDRKENMTLTHGSVHEPEEFHYLFREEDTQPSFKRLETRFGFFGHTHIPSLFSKSLAGKYLPAGIYELDKKDTYLINPGSVGQPRDRNPKLSFAFFDSEELTLEIVRLDYDNRKAAAKIRQAGLPAFLADRLL
jgi:predicted phosphodiesterase